MWEIKVSFKFNNEEKESVFVTEFINKLIKKYSLPRESSPIIAELIEKFMFYLEDVKEFEQALLNDNQIKMYLRNLKLRRLSDIPNGESIFIENTFTLVRTGILEK